jgi:chloramphenicol 3-O phosphotransferase
MKHSQLIMLNGTSSAGKTSIVNCLHARLPGMPLNLGLDKFLNTMHESWFRQPQWNDIMGKSNASGPLGDHLISGMHHALDGLLRQGHTLISDHVLIEKSWVKEAAKLFSEHRAFLIGVKCPVEVIEQRERDRKNRTLGSARLQFDVVHRWIHECGGYDLELDSSEASPDSSAEKILQFLATQPTPRAFSQVLQKIELSR